MPNQRDKNKVVTSIGLHKDILAALRMVSGENLSRYIAELTAKKLKFTLDEKGYPVGLDLKRLKKRK